MPTKGTVYIGKPLAKKVKGGNKNAAEKLQELAVEANRILYELTSVFPFQLFPDRIIIDENKVTIARKDLFFKRVYSIMFDDMLTVRVNRGILFAAMEFEIKRTMEKLRPITHLRPKEATLAKKFILGLMEAKRAKIDMTELSVQEIKGRLLAIGQAKDEAETLF